MSKPSIEDWQIASIALDAYACGGNQVGATRRKDDPVYQEIVQGRDVPAVYTHYSSCADRAHWKLWRLGCRLPFLNRTAPNETPPRHWVPGVNITNLWDRKLGAPVLRRPGAGWLPLPGDELLIWNTGNDAHSCAIMSYAADNMVALTANYGAAGMAPTPIGGARVSETPLYFNGQDWLCGPATHRRIVQAVLRIADYVPTLTVAPDLSGLPGDAFSQAVRESLEQHRSDT